MIIKKCTNTNGTKFLELEQKGKFDFRLYLIIKEYNPQEEITEYKEKPILNLYSLKKALFMFNKYKKQFKLDIELKGGNTE